MSNENGSGPRRAAVVGSPVGHSLSPVLHRAAFVALDLTGWSYERIECDAERLPALVAGLGPEWAGLSVTMPGKRAALELAEAATPRATAVGAANTLVPVPGGGGWQADCTDVDGVVGALRAAAGYRPRPGAPGVVLGAGGTAAAALAAFAELGIGETVLVVREPARAAEALACADRVGIGATTVRWAEADLRGLAREAAAVVSTVPAEATADHADVLAAAPYLLDVIYHPWPTPIAEAVARRGGRLATGLDMLLHQAFGQVEQFTGLPAPREAMRDALRTATHGVLPLPL
ncbi:shikimate dehydrogenase [Gandjariella thermophila]|uniref:Shikimate dehydrogenase n=1 Tax=Gandjariella thermophila TaxID=1931992 RepID=A0A4D4IXC5_9PSEU|nr:shikimate dehydrogenase [Gandjariella thermophila]GDY28851.1 shikimate dehydrogenase [Gandjariella thermophila]